MRKLLFMAGWLALLPAAMAQNAPQMSFEQLDANKDGRISVSEARKDKVVAARFAKADANQDGYLDRKEFASIPRE
jgi:Ca2+-binding EF-hand superfamily protein